MASLLAAPAVPGGNENRLCWASGAVATQTTIHTMPPPEAALTHGAKPPEIENGQERHSTARCGLGRWAAASQSKGPEGCPTGEADHSLARSATAGRPGGQAEGQQPPSPSRPGTVWLLELQPGIAGFLWRRLSKAAGCQRAHESPRVGM